MDSVIKLTDAAAAKIKSLIESDQEKIIIGIRVGVKAKGCLGLSYFMDLEQKSDIDPAISSFVQENKGISIFIDKKAYDFISGTEIDFIDEGFRSEFVFNNPNAKQKCSCGSSFCVR